MCIRRKRGLYLATPEAECHCRCTLAVKEIYHDDIDTEYVLYGERQQNVIAAVLLVVQHAQMQTIVCKRRQSI